jgi:hypothetical protein
MATIASSIRCYGSFRSRSYPKPSQLVNQVSDGAVRRHIPCQKVAIDHTRKMGMRDSQQGEPGHETDPENDIADRLVPSKDRQLAHVDHRKLSHLYKR